MRTVSYLDPNPRMLWLILVAIPIYWLVMWGIRPPKVKPASASTQHRVTPYRARHYAPVIYARGDVARYVMPRSIVRQLEALKA